MKLTKDKKGLDTMWHYLVVGVLVLIVLVILIMISGAAKNGFKWIFDILGGST